MNDFKYFSYNEFEASATAKEHGIDNGLPSITALNPYSATLTQAMRRETSRIKSGTPGGTLWYLCRDS